MGKGEGEAEEQGSWAAQGQRGGLLRGQKRKKSPGWLPYKS